MLNSLKLEHKSDNQQVDLNTALENLNEANLNTLIINFDKLEESQKTNLITKLENDLSGYKDGDNYKVARSYELLLKLELLCKLKPDLNVGVEKYDAAKDQCIKGAIQDVKKDASGNITYWVDCAKTGKDIKASWLFKTQENSDTATIIGTKQGENEKDYKATIGMEYTWDAEQGYFINKNKKVTATSV